MQRGQGVSIGGVNYRVDLGNPFTASTLPLSSAYAGVSGNLTLLALSQSTLVITMGDVEDSAPYAQTRVGGLRLTAKAGANLKDAQSTAPASTATALLAAGSWGAHTAPVLLSFVAADVGGAAGLNTGDAVTLTFNQVTNVPNITTKQDIDEVLLFSSPLGSGQ